MAAQDNTGQAKTPSWGAPAASSTPKTVQTQNVTSQPNPFSNDQSYQHSHSPNSQRYQRPSPYHNNNNRGRGGNMGNTFQSNRNQNNSPTFQSQIQSFSPRNPFFNQSQNFSSDNPFQSKAQNFSPSNPFQNNGQYSSPNHRALTRPTFHSGSPTRAPGIASPSFSPRTPHNNFNTPSPRGFGYQRSNSDSSRRFGQRNNSNNNPGGSNNIQDYVNPGMLEDPWKDLPPTAILQSY